MCGIVGQVGKPIDEGLLSVMRDRLEHRGPDDAGQLNFAKGGVAMRRLSVIDLAGGHQPILNEDGTLAIVYNGEVYNFGKLRSRLRSAGHLFKTGCDTEVLLHLYEERGERCVDELRGMFAFAIVHLDSGRCFMARDRLGKKPLFYALAHGALVFGSELKALLVHPDLAARELDAAALPSHLLFGYVPGERTLIEGIRRLPPAHCLTFEGGKVRLSRYWEPVFEPKLELDPDEAAELVAEKLAESVSARLVSDVPLGLLLSGGIDSAAVAKAMVSAGAGEIRSFCVGFEEGDFDERPAARAVARELGLRHQDILIEPSVEQVFEDLVWHLDEPLNDSSALPTYHIARFARQHVTVALAGDGGDEAFAGYDRYRFERVAAIYRRFPALLSRRLVPALLNIVPSTGAKRGRIERAKRFATAAGREPGEAYLSLLRPFEPETVKALLGGEIEAGGLGLTADGPMAGIDLGIAMDLAGYLPGDLLVKMDRMSMAHSLEVRSPFLDHELLSLGLRLPDAVRADMGKGKLVLRRLLRGVIPDEVLNRPKQGFGVPVDRWFRGPLEHFARERLLGGVLLSDGLLSHGALQELLDEHVRRRRDHGQRLWGLLVLDEWLRQLPKMRRWPINRV